jgi:hypothetical protein
MSDSQSTDTTFQIVDPKAVAFLLLPLYGAYYLLRLVWMNVRFLLAGQGIVFSLAGMIPAILFLGLGFLILRQNPLYGQVNPASKVVTCWRGILGRNEVVEADASLASAITLHQDLRKRGRKKRMVTILGLQQGDVTQELIVDVRAEQLRQLGEHLARALGVPFEKKS